MAIQRPSGMFPTTIWTQVQEAGQDRAVLGRLLERYLPALRAHLVIKKRVRQEWVDDLLQEFVQQKILEQEILAKADRTRGSRFRSFLLTTLDHFLISQIRRRSAASRAPDKPMMDIDDHPDAGGGVSHADPFDVAWAQQVVQAAIERMQRECEGKRRADVWEVFEARLLRPAFQGQDPLPYEELVKRLPNTSPVQIGNLVITAKRMFRRHLEQVVAEYSSDDDEVKSELDELMSALAGAGA